MGNSSSLQSQALTHTPLTPQSLQPIRQGVGGFNGINPLVTSGRRRRKKRKYTLPRGGVDYHKPNNIDNIESPQHIQQTPYYPLTAHQPPPLNNDLAGNPQSNSYKWPVLFGPTVPTIDLPELDQYFINERNNKYQPPTNILHEMNPIDQMNYQTNQNRLGKDTTDRIMKIQQQM